MADEVLPMKQLNIADKNGVTHHFEIKDEKARNDIDSAKALNFNDNQFSVIETSSAVNIEIHATSGNQNNYLRGDGTWVDLEGTKQNNLSAGDGIDITNDVVSHSIKVIENNNQEDTVSGTVFTVYLKNNHYKVITFDKTITEIIFMIEKTAANVLQETRFEFTVPEDSDLETLTFRVINDNNKKVYTIIPDSYTSPNIYQGTIVNYRCTIGEYEVED